MLACTVHMSGEWGNDTGRPHVRHLLSAPWCANSSKTPTLPLAWLAKPYLLSTMALKVKRVTSRFISHCPIHYTLYWLQWFGRHQSERGARPVKYMYLSVTGTNVRWVRSVSTGIMMVLVLSKTPKSTISSSSWSIFHIPHSSCAFSNSQ
jgi:hypothetical protein